MMVLVIKFHENEKEIHNIFNMNYNFKKFYGV